MHTVVLFSTAPPFTPKRDHQWSVVPSLHYDPHLTKRHGQRGSITVKGQKSQAGPHATVTPSCLLTVQPAEKGLCSQQSWPPSCPTEACPTPGEAEGPQQNRA